MRQRLLFFNVTRELDRDTKRRLVPTLRRAEKEFLVADFYSHFVMYGLLILYTVVMIGYAIAIPTFAAIFLGTRQTAFEWLITVLGILGAVTLGGLLVVVPLMVNDSVPRILRVPGVMMGGLWLIAVGASGWVLFYVSESSEPAVLELLVAAAACAVLTTLAFGLGIRFASLLIHNRILRQIPESAFIEGHLTVLHILEHHDEEKPDLRGIAAQWLEKLAVIAEKHLVRNLSAGDKLTDEWLRQAFSEIAASIRAFKRGILVPSKDWKGDTQHYIARRLTLALEGDWQAFDRATPERALESRSLVVRATALLRTALLAGLPALGLWLVQQTSLALDSPLRSYAVVVTLVWAVVTVFASLDPLFWEKVLTLREVVRPGAFPLTPKDTHEHEPPDEPL